MEQERDELDEMAICMDVDNDVIDQLRDGRLTQIVVDGSQKHRWTRM